MTFWANKNTEPLRQNRWYILFSDTNLNKYIYALKECQKPSYEVSVTEHKLLTQTFKYPGLLKWKPIEVKMVSTRVNEKTNSGSLAFLLDNYSYSSGYKPPKAGSHQEIDKYASIIEENGLQIKQVNENGKDIEVWTLQNPFISNVNYGTLSYENDGFVDISFTIQYDWAEQEDKKV